MHRTVIRLVVAAGVVLTPGCSDDDVSRSDAVEIISEQTLADETDATCIVDAMLHEGMDLNRLVDDSLPDSFQRQFDELVAACLLG